MANCYVDSSICLLNAKTEELKNLDELGIYLAKQNNPSALQVLKLILIASENSLLDKEFHINTIKKSIEIKKNEERKITENIATNLARNPLNLGLELFEYIIKNYKINLHIEPYNTGLTTIDFWLRSLKYIEYNYDIFYKRYDMVDKRLDIIEYLLENYSLSDDDINEIIHTLNICLSSNCCSFSKEQLSRIQLILNSLLFKNQLRKNLANLTKDKKIVTKYSKDWLVKKLLEQEKKDKKDNKSKKSDRRWYFHEELDSFWMSNDDCWYIADNIPELIKNKVIK